MQRSAELDLALDIDDLAAAHPHLRGDSGRVAEGERAEADHGEPVDLTDYLARIFYADRAARDLLLHAPVDTVAAANLRIERALNLGGADHLLAGVGGELIGLLEQFVDRSHAGRQPLGIPGKASRVLDHPSDSVAVEGAQMVAPHDRG